MKIEHYFSCAAMRRAVCFGVFVAILGSVAGCKSLSSSALGGGFPLMRASQSGEHAAQKEVEEASKLIDAGDTTTVIPRLLHTISQYPDSKAAVEARYWLGMAYYKIGDYPDAINLFSEYVEKAPQGVHAAESSDIIAKATKEYEAKHPSLEQLDAMIADAESRVQANAQDVKARLEVADLRWRRGDYERAGNEYQAILRDHPEYSTDPTIKSRLEIDRNGAVTLLTPAEQQRRQNQAQPLVVINTQSFRSGEDVFTRERRFYAVSGQVVNRSDSVLYGIEVNVTIFGVGNVVFDTTSVGIRRLNPGEIRAFSVRFTNFENIENVNRYECVATFER